MRVAFLGLGLIGGSIALATRSPDRVLTAWTPTGDGPRAAHAVGAIDVVASTPADAVAGADLVIVAAPPLACLELIAWLGGEGRRHLRPGATVTDVASTKKAIMVAARDVELPFVGGHPMAGKETTGFGAADRDLFRGRPWIVTEGLFGGDPQVVRQLAMDAGAIVVGLRSVDHDRAVAAISHLPLLASVALVEAVLGVDDEPAPPLADVAARLAAGGWQGMTRLARGDVAMATGIALTNRDPLVAQLLAYRDRIDAWLAELDVPGEPDAGRVTARFAAARRRLDETAG